MTLFFPDLNVWLALTVEQHPHAATAWNWFDSQKGDDLLVFSRYTQLGFLRLLTSATVMGERRLTLNSAWEFYDRWMSDKQVVFCAEPSGVDRAFRQALAPFGGQPASKCVGDCYLLAFAVQSDATLLTFDRKLHAYARKQGCPAVIPD